jgi:mannitol/fructose-specific phosphotransferase system IIA component (Ntr-type)/Kef-type K+ transport system membrane component KefB
MSLIAVNIGGHLSYRKIHNSLRRIISISLFEVLVTAIVVALLTRLFGMDWPSSLLLCTIAISTAPATTIALVRETRSKGPFVKTLVATVALNNIFCLLLFVMMRSFVAAYFENGDTTGSVPDALLMVAFHLFGSILLGFAVGWVSKILVSQPKFHDFSTILLAILVCDGLAACLGLSPLLACLFFGVYLGNSSQVAEKQLTTLLPLEPVLYLCFFSLAGVSLHMDAVMSVGSLMLIYFGARALGKTLGVTIGGWIGRCSPRIWRNMAIALYPQAGIAIGLALLLSNDTHFPESIRHTVSAIILAGVALSELIGPPFTKLALARSQEAGKDRQRLVEFLAEEFIIVNLKASDKWDAIRQMTAFLIRTHRVEHVCMEDLFQTVAQREKNMSTYCGKGVAIPHGHIEKGPAIQGVLAISREGIDYENKNREKVHLIMLVVTPADHKDAHLKVIASLSAMVRDDAIRERIIAAISPEDAMEVIESEEARDYNYFLE